MSRVQLRWLNLDELAMTDAARSAIQVIVERATGKNEWEPIGVMRAWLSSNEAAVTPQLLDAVLDVISNHQVTSIKPYPPVTALRTWLLIPAWPSMDYVDYPNHIPIRHQRMAPWIRSLYLQPKLD